jgi:hypothetical protein
MADSAPDVLEASRLPALCRGVCLYAGLPLPPATAPGERFVVRTGSTTPGLLTALLAEAFVEDGIEVEDWSGPGPCATAKVAVRPGYGAPCPAPEELLAAVTPDGGSALLFAVERCDEAGRVLGVTWAAVSEEEPPPQGRFRAAVRSHDVPE